MTLDPSPSFADLLLWDLLSRHKVVFPVHQHLNHLVLELVVFVVVSAVVPDFVQTRVAEVLVPVLARPASPVVLVLDETALVLELVLLCCFCGCDGDCGGGCCFCEEDWRWSLLLCQVLLSGYTMFGTFIGVVFSNSHQHLSHLSLCG